MDPAIPFYISALVIVIVGGLLYGIYYALNYALIHLNYTPQKKTKIIAVTFILLTGWLVFSSVMAFSGTLLEFTSTPPKIFTIIFPAVLTVIYLSTSDSVNKLLTVIPSSWLVYIQIYRVLVEVVLWLLFIKNIIPIQMTFEGLNYDILIGLSALLVGYYSLSMKKWPRSVAVLWNIAGLLLVTNIFIVSFLSTPSLFRQFFNEPSNTMVAYFPFVWFPAIIVPFAYLMHILSIKQLLRNYN